MIFSAETQKFLYDNNITLNEKYGYIDIEKDTEIINKKIYELLEEEKLSSQKKNLHIYKKFNKIFNSICE